MTARAVRLCVEDQPEVLLTEVLFHRQLKAGLAVVEKCYTQSDAISRGMSYLLMTSESVAVLVNARTEDSESVDETRGAMLRLLAGCALEGWVAALAVPAMDVWVLTDPRL